MDKEKRILEFKDWVFGEFKKEKKYYFDIHLEEVSKLVRTHYTNFSEEDKFISELVAYGHDCLEDLPISYDDIRLKLISIGFEYL